MPSVPTVPPPGLPTDPLIHWLEDQIDDLTEVPGLLWHLASAHVPLLAVALGVLAAVKVGGRAMLWRWRCHHHAQGARLVEVHVPPVVNSDSAAVWWRHLAGLHTSRWKRLLYGQPHVGFEYRGGVEGVQFQIWVPGAIPPGTVEGIVRASWSGATVVTRPAEHLVPVRAAAVGGRMALGNTDHYPLTTSHESDPIRGLLEAMSGLREGEHAAVQVLARPITGRRLRKARRAASHLRGARSRAPQAALFDLAAPGGDPYRQARPWELSQMFPERAAQVRAILNKANQPRFAVQITYAAATLRHLPQNGTTPTSATHRKTVSGSPLSGTEEVSHAGLLRRWKSRRRVRGWLRTRAHQIAAVFGQYAAADQHLRRRHLVSLAYHLNSRNLEHGYLLAADELAALAHLPHEDDAPGITRAGARPVAPSPRVPARVLLPAGGPVRILGDSDAGPPRPVGLAVTGARQHVHVLGQTGVGKSTFLASQILADAKAGRGALVIDPKGDLIVDLLDRLPERAIGKTVVFDPVQDGPPPCVNVLAGPDPAFAAEAIVTTFRRCFSANWGPRMDDLMRSACLTLTHTRGNNATLADLPRLLDEGRFRHQITGTMNDRLLVNFWKGYDELSPGARAALVSPIMNKLRAVLLRPFVRDALSGGPSTVHLGQVLSGGGLVLVRASKGMLGDDAARLLGSLILAQTWQAMTPRAALPEDDRRDVSAYVDEAHNFLNLPGSVSDILAEARAYRFSMVIAHQHLSQLPKDLRDAVSADARNKIYFAVSPEDASVLTHHTAPLLSAHDLAHLGAFQAAARTICGTAPAPPFTFRTRPLPEPIPGRADAIRQASQAAYSPALAQDETERRPANDLVAKPPAPLAPRFDQTASHSRSDRSPEN
ncbi:type IV secretory system conjugative DNA transfer family protein [Spirillospora sp. NPDC127200]